MTKPAPLRAAIHLFRTFRLALLGTAVTIGLVGCAADPNGAGGAFSSNASKAYIYTAQEQAEMSSTGTIPTMLTPSEVRAHLENVQKNKVTKPTGEVNYCDAGLAQLIQSRRQEALKAIADACGSDEQYAITFEGLGNVKARYVGNFQITPSCTRSKVIIFRCTGAQPKPDLRK